MKKNLCFLNNIIKGQFNIEFSTELANNLGGVLGNICGSEGVVVSDDNTHTSCLIKNAIANGVISGGGRVWDVENVGRDVAIFGIERLGARYGAIVSTENGGISVEIVDKNAKPINYFEQIMVKKGIENGEFEKAKENELNIKVKAYGLDKKYFKMNMSRASGEFAEELMDISNKENIMD